MKAKRANEQHSNRSTGKKLWAPTRAFSISRLYCRFSDFFLRRPKLKTASNLRRWLFSRKVCSVYQASTGRRVYSITTNFSSRFYFPARKHIWIYNVTMYANKCYVCKYKKKINFVILVFTRQKCESIGRKEIFLKLFLIHNDSRKQYTETCQFLQFKKLLVLF